MHHRKTQDESEIVSGLPRCTSNKRGKFLYGCCTLALKLVFLVFFSFEHSANILARFPANMNNGCGSDKSEVCHFLHEFDRCSLIHILSAEPSLYRILVKTVDFDPIVLNLAHELTGNKLVRLKQIGVQKQTFLRSFGRIRVDEKTVPEGYP